MGKGSLFLFFKCILYTISVNIIGSKEKGGTLLSQGNLLFLFYGSIHFFIHSYSGAVLGLLFVTGFDEKLYKILHALSVGVFRNAGGTPSPSS
ncbi:hypothetical protein FME64_27630 [Bacillus thuringiensis]|uniref:Uncharacterized protein n=1 Tax=Bacillus thuringiensis TaxID=1428 RepID=A0AAW4HY90_BACTU|nr:hypothetical protein [Bacillus thuringiensis]